MEQGQRVKDPEQEGVWEEVRAGAAWVATAQEQELAVIVSAPPAELRSLIKEQSPAIR